MGRKRKGEVRWIKKDQRMFESMIELHAALRSAACSAGGALVAPFADRLGAIITEHCWRRQ